MGGISVLPVKTFLVLSKTPLKAQSLVIELQKEINGKIDEQPVCVRYSQCYANTSLNDISCK